MLKIDSKRGFPPFGRGRNVLEREAHVVGLVHVSVPKVLKKKKIPKIPGGSRDPPVLMLNPPLGRSQARGGQNEDKNCSKSWLNRSHASRRLTLRTMCKYTWKMMSFIVSWAEVMCRLRHMGTSGA